MEIQSFHIHGFGHFLGAGIDPLPQGLIVVYAPNGAGKTTLRDFLRAGLFGFTRDDKNRYAVDAPHANGGTVNFAVRSGGSYQLMFDARKNKSMLKSIEGQPLPELGSLLGSASPQLYRNVFAIGLQELQDARHLDDEKVQTMIGAFGSGRSGQVFQNVRSVFIKEMEDRFKPSGSVPRANKLLSDLKALQEELKRLKAESDTYWSYEEQSVKLHEESAAARENEEKARGHRDHLVTLAKAWPDWILLRNVKQQLAEVEPLVEDFPAGGVEKLKRLSERLEALKEEFAARRLDLEKARHELAALNAPAELLKASAEIDDVSGRFALFEQNSERALKASHDTAEAARKQAAELEKLGGWTALQLANFNDNVASLAEKAEAARQLNEAEANHAACKLVYDRLVLETQGKKTEASEARSAFLTQWPKAPATQRDLEERVLALTTIRTKIADIARLTDKKAQYEREVEAAESEIAGLQGKLAAPVAVAPVPAQAALNPLRPVGWALLGGGLVLAALLYRTPAAAAVALVLGLAGFAFCWRYSVAAPVAVQAPVVNHDAYFEAQLVSWREKQAQAVKALAENENLIVAAEAELAAHGRLFGDRRLTDADCTDLQTKLLRAGEERRQWEQGERQVVKLEEAAGEREAELEAREEEMLRATARQKAARTRWGDWLRANDLPEGMTPEATEAFCRQIELARAADSEFKALQATLGRLQQQLEEYRAASGALLVKLGRPEPAASDLGPALRRLREDRDKARLDSQRGNDLNKTLPEQEATVARLTADLERFEGERQILLKAGAAANDDEFFRRAAAWERREQLENESRSLLSRLEVLSGPGAPVLRLQEELNALDWEVLEGQRLAAESELRAATEALREYNIRRGEIDQARSQLATSEDIAVCNGKIESAAAELNDLAEEWAVRKLAHWLMEKARDKYETERQPAVLQSASACLATMTNGHITRIVKPIDGGKYRLHYADNTFKDDDQTWNTALKEQTYLSLRFGLIEAYSLNSEPLPIILDDALVNLDPRHLQGAIDSIHELARRHQVIYLTCHPHTLQCFAALGEAPAFYRIADRQFHAAPLSDMVQTEVA